MKLYLDTCSLHRPFDDRTQFRVAQEAEAVVAILALCEAGAASLISSEPLALEISNNPDAEQRELVSETLAVATIHVMIDGNVRRRAHELGAAGFTTFDALHLAVAEAAQVDYFCTCDDRLLKRCGRQSDLPMRVVSPRELSQEIIP